MLIDWFTVVAQVFNFLVLVWLLKRFLYKPILHAIDEREAKIAARLENAEKIQADAKKESAELKDKIKKIDDQRASLLRKATDEAQAERERLLEEARKAAEDFGNKRHAAFKREEAQIQKALAEQTQKEVFELTRKVLIDLSGTTLEAQMVNVFLQRLIELDDKKKKQLAATLTPKNNFVARTKGNSGDNSREKSGVLRSSFELTPKQRTEIENAICELSGNSSKLHFEVVPELLSGIELVVNGQKLAWNIDSYLATIEKEVHSLLTSEAQSP